MKTWLTTGFAMLCVFISNIDFLLFEPIESQAWMGLNKFCFYRCHVFRTVHHIALNVSRAMPVYLNLISLNRAINAPKNFMFRYLILRLNSIKCIKSDNNIINNFEGVEQRPFRWLESTGCDVDTHLKKQLICFSLQVENEKNRPQPRSAFGGDCERMGLTGPVEG